MIFRFEFAIGFKVKKKNMTFRFKFTIGFKVKKIWPFRFEFTIGFKVKKIWHLCLNLPLGLKLGLNFKIMTGGYNNKNYDRWVKKKKIWPLIGDINSTASVRSSILAIRWSETSIRRRSSETSIRRRSSETLLQQSANRWWRYNGRRHQSVGPSDLHHKRLYWPSHRCW